MKVKELTEIKNEYGKPANENILWLHKEDELAATIGDSLKSSAMLAKVSRVYLKESHNAIVIVIDNDHEIANGTLTGLIKDGLITVNQ